MSCRVPTPPLPDENEIVEVIKEVPVEVPAAAAATNASSDSVMQILTELRDNMLAMSHHLQATAECTKKSSYKKSLPDIPDMVGDMVAPSDTLPKTSTEPSHTTL